jgi:flagellar basal-body rod protein FlgF
MKIYNGIYLNEDGLSNSLRSMHLQTSILGTINENITGFDKVGYQRKDPIVSSFAEYLGTYALKEIPDRTVGRIKETKNPLDFALIKDGYLKYQTPNGTNLTRDGRLMLDKNGFILTLDSNKIIGTDGNPIQLKKIPNSYEDIKVSNDGTISYLDRDTNKLVDTGKFAVVNLAGKPVEEVDIRQGYTENSNVKLEREFFALLPVRRNFEANRQMYILQNDELSRVISELGRTS